MITITGVNCTGLFAFEYAPTIPLLNQGLIFIHGINEDHNNSSNGAGKSSILNAIKEILYGRNDTGYSGKHAINKHDNWKNGHFGIVWLTDHNGCHWRVMSVRNWKGPPIEASNGPSEVLSTGGSYQDTDVFLEYWDGSWKDARPTSMGNKVVKDTRIKIVEEVLRMTYDQFSAYVCLGQKAESILVTGTSGEREKIIQAVVDASLWNKAAEIVKSSYTTKNNELSLLDNKIVGMQTTIQSINIPTQDEIDSIQGSIQEVNNKVTETKSKLELAVQETAQKMEEWTEATKRAADVRQELDILDAEERHALERLQEWTSPNKPEILMSVESTIHDYQVRISDSNALINRYQNLGIGKCSTCGQEVTEKHLDVEISRLMSLIEAMEEDHASANTTFHKESKKHEINEEASKQLAQEQYEHEIFHINKKRSELKGSTDIAIDREREYQQELTQKTTIEHEITMLEGKLSNLNMELQYANSRVQEREALVQTLTVECDKRNLLASEIKHYLWTERNLLRVKLDEYNSAIERLNQLMEEKIRRLWGPGLEARFITAKEKVKGGVKPGLDVIVNIPNKEEMPTGMCSGGQLKIIVVALFKAIRKLMQERGLGVNLSGIDELDKELDDYNTDALVNAFEDIAEDSPTCLVISHNSRLLNTMRFDKVWTVRMKDGISTIELQQEESVAA
jgi:DNA repair exonuclease SbcCD ATPase subunit